MAPSHYDFGLQLGRAAKELIGAELDANPFLQQTALPYIATAKGKALLDRFIAVNNASYPHYFDEIRGMAEGSQRPLLHLVIMNLLQELSYFIPAPPWRTPRPLQLL